jgi:hypothetical protein
MGGFQEFGSPMRRLRTICCISLEKVLSAYRSDMFSYRFCKAVHLHEPVHLQGVEICYSEVSSGQQARRRWLWRSLPGMPLQKILAVMHIVVVVVYGTVIYVILCTWDSYCFGLFKTRFLSV